MTDRDTSGTPGRVLLIAPQPFYSDRGTPMNVREMCRVLGAHGYAVDLLTYPLGVDVELPGVEIHRCPGLPGVREVPIGFSLRKLAFTLPLFFHALWLWLRRRHPLVHGVEEGAFLAMPFSWFGARLIYDLDSIISDQLFYSGALRARPLIAAVRAIERLTLRRSAVAITVCRALSDAARALEPGAAIHQIEDMPLPETLRPPVPAQMARLRAEVDCGERPIVLYTGNLESYQGIELAIEAVRRLQERDNAPCLVVVGGSKVHRSTLARRIETQGLADSVRLMGPRPPSEMADWMGLAAALVSPRSEGTNTPLKLYSYMASGIPIVATRRLTHTQVLDDDTAFLCEPNAEDMANYIAELLAQPEGASARGRAARELALREYAPESFARKLLAAYAEAAA